MRQLQYHILLKELENFYLGKGISTTRIDQVVTHELGDDSNVVG